MEKEYVVAIIGVFGAVLAAVIPVWYQSKKKKHTESEVPSDNGPNFSQTLSDVLSLAEMQSRRDGKEVTSTRYFFSAALHLCPEEIKGLLVELQKTGAMPDPTPPEVAAEPRRLQMDRPFSACIRNSISSLQPLTTNDSPLTVSDVFVDVAKYGRGSSVAKLREANIGPQDIDNMVSQFSINVPHKRQA